MLDILQRELGLLYPMLEGLLAIKNKSRVRKRHPVMELIMDLIELKKKS